MELCYLFIEIYNLHFIGLCSILKATLTNPGSVVDNYNDTIILLTSSDINFGIVHVH